ncbi:lariat debranching enzyme [Dimargaris cristalligena]|nr:lariat debranching enzyme [Dimargaris cristalligena]
MPLNIAVVGCCHGELPKIYERLGSCHGKIKSKVDLLIICGDFQAIRNTYDLDSLAVPTKYRKLGYFGEFYTGKRKARVPTIFIGGNHESSSFMTELYLGGWVCPDIYYMGHSGVVQFNGLRIGGISGVYYESDYNKGNVYHTRHYDYLKLKQIEQPLDIFISHDWPRGIEHHGNINTNTLGNPVTIKLLDHLQPNHWFSGHLHVRYQVNYKHPLDLERTKELLNYQMDLPVDPNDPEASSLFIAPEPLAQVETSNPDEVVVNLDSGDSEHESEGALPSAQTHSSTEATATTPKVLTKNPDELDIEVYITSDDSDTVAPWADFPPSAPASKANLPTAHSGGSVPNPDALDISMSSSDSEGELVGDKRKGPKPSSQESSPKRMLQGKASPGSAVPETSQPTVLPDMTNIRKWPRLRSPTNYTGVTKFLALDKCGVRREYLELIELDDTPVSNALRQARLKNKQTPAVFTYDPEWLAITRAMQQYMPTEVYDTKDYPPKDELKKVVDQEMVWVFDNLIKPSKNPYPLTIPHNFKITAPVSNFLRGPMKRTLQDKFKSGNWDKRSPSPPLQTEPIPGGGGSRPVYFNDNPQTVGFCNKLQIPNMIQASKTALNMAKKIIK